MGEDALAHVTFCQFYGDTDAGAQDVFSRLKLPTLWNIDIIKFQMRAGASTNTGFQFGEYVVDKTETLSQLQHETHGALITAGFESLTKPEAYHPHFTLARTGVTPPSLPSLADLPYTQNISMRPSVGVSSETGVFIRELI